MQLAINISLPNVLTLISQMSLNEIEEVKNKIYTTPEKPNNILKILISNTIK